MGVNFSPTARDKFKNILSRYPDKNKRAALLPTLFLAQEEFGHLSVEALDYVADQLELPASKVLAVATFYTMYNKRPVGTYHVQVCVSISCALMGAHRLLHGLEKRLGCRVGENSSDGRWTLSEVECLASCGTGPMMQVTGPSSDDYFETLDPELTKDALNELIDKGERAADKRKRKAATR